MHDPSVVIARLSRPGLRRHQPGRWMSRHDHHIGPVDLTWPTLITVWHNEPDGRDAGEVCGRQGWHGPKLARARWALAHRAHLRLQVHPWQTACRRLFTRCDECGHPFRHGDMAISAGGWDSNPGPGWRVDEHVLHRVCSGYRSFRAQAAEAITMLDIVHDLAEYDGLPAAEVDRRWAAAAQFAGERNLAFRIRRRLEQLRKSADAPPADRQSSTTA